MEAGFLGQSVGDKKPVARGKQRETIKAAPLKRFGDTRC
jgi:hypothetical protein